MPLKAFGTACILGLITPFAHAANIIEAWNQVKAPRPLTWYR